MSVDFGSKAQVILLSKEKILLAGQMTQLSLKI